MSCSLQLFGVAKVVFYLKPKSYVVWSYVANIDIVYVDAFKLYLLTIYCDKSTVEVMGHYTCAMFVRSDTSSISKVKFEKVTFVYYNNMCVYG